MLLLHVVERQVSNHVQGKDEIDIRKSSISISYQHVMKCHAVQVRHCLIGIGMGAARLASGPREKSSSSSHPASPAMRLTLALYWRVPKIRQSVPLRLKISSHAKPLHTLSPSVFKPTTLQPVKSRSQFRLDQQLSIRVAVPFEYTRYTELRTRSTSPPG